MTKEKYMALADFQSLWTSKLKPYIIQSYAAKGHTHSDKADKVSGNVNNHLAALNSNGNLKDSGYSADDLYDGTLYPVNIDAMTPTSTFRKNALLFINGIGYKAITDTSEFPVSLLIENNQFVVNVIDGDIAFVVTDDTVSEDWVKFGDAGIPFAMKNIELTFEAAMEQHEADVNRALAQKASMADVLSAPITSTGGDTYNIVTLLTAIADLMDKKVVTEE